MSCLHLLQQLFGRGDFSMEEALLDTPLYRSLAGLGEHDRIPDRVSILRFRHLMVKHDLAKQFFEAVNDMLRVKGLMLQSGTVVDATIIATPSSTKNSTGKREGVQDIEVNWLVEMRPGKRRVLDKQSPLDATLDKIEQLKARFRAKVEHPFRVIKRQFAHTKARYRGLAKNTAQLLTLFMLLNLCMVRKRFMQTTV